MVIRKDIPAIIGDFLIANIESSDFKEEFDFEVSSNNLKDKIQLHLIQEPIKEIAQIDKRSGIGIYENFNQFVWCCSYAMFVIFDEGIQKPTLNGQFRGELEMSNPFVRRALELFGRGVSLIEHYDKAIFYDLPNPEKYNEFERFYITPVHRAKNLPN